MPSHDPMDHDDRRRSRRSKQDAQNEVEQLARQADDVEEVCDYLMDVAARIKAKREVVGGDDVALQMKLGELQARAHRQLSSIQDGLNTSARPSRPAGPGGGRPPAGRGGRVVDSRSRGRAGNEGWLVAGVLLLVLLAVGVIYVLGQGALELPAELPTSNGQPKLED